MKQTKPKKQTDSGKQAQLRVKKIDPLEPLKMEIAAELGLLEQAEKNGWHSLSAKDAGRIGGLMTQRRRQGKQEMAKGLEASDG